MSTITVEEVQRVAGELARLRDEIGRLHDQLADAQLQLGDARADRDLAEHEQRVAEALQTAIANNAAIEQAIGIIAEKAGVTIAGARTRIKKYSRDHGEQMRSVVAAIVAGQDQAAALGHGDPEVTRIIASGGIPVEFWHALTLNGAIFE